MAVMVLVKLRKKDLVFKGFEKCLKKTSMSLVGKKTIPVFCVIKKVITLPTTLRDTSISKIKLQTNQFNFTIILSTLKVYVSIYCMLFILQTHSSI